MTDPQLPHPVLLANFGGPRSLEEVSDFLTELLTDQDVVRSGLPSAVHRRLFGWIAQRRSEKIKKDYALIGGKSPIFEDTETLAETLRHLLKRKVITLHRYLPATHPGTLKQLEDIKDSVIDVLPMFPQFTYATSGSLARWLQNNLSSSSTKKLRWIRSYADFSPFVELFFVRIREFLKEQHLEEGAVFFLFSAHGLPKKFVATGDPYQAQCEASFASISSAFPLAKSLLSYQSKFGPGEWLRPYTAQVCHSILDTTQGRKTVIVIPLSFTSDHIETLFEVEYQYLPMIRRHGLQALRLPAFNQDPRWPYVLESLLATSTRYPNASMIWQPL